MLLILEYLSCCIAADRLENWIAFNFPSDNSNNEDNTVKADEAAENKKAEAPQVESQEETEQEDSEQTEEITVKSAKGKEKTPDIAPVAENTRDTEAETVKIAELSSSDKAESITEVSVGSENVSDIEESDEEKEEEAQAKDTEKTEIAEQAEESEKTVVAEKQTVADTTEEEKSLDVSLEEIEKAREAEKTELAKKAAAKGEKKNDEPLGYFYNGIQDKLSYLKMELTSNRASKKKIYLRCFYLFKDYLPYNYNFKYMDMYKIDKEQFPPLTFAINFAELSFDEDDNSIIIFKGRKYSSLENLITPYDLKVKMDDPNSKELASNFVFLPLCNPLNNEKFDAYIKVQDPVERETKLKKFVLGNVNFIGELINIQILSKKIVFQCIDNLFARFNKEEADKSLKMINLEAIVILLDNFGTLLKAKEAKMKEEDKKEFNEKVTSYLKKLEEVNEKEQGIVQYIKYKIINLIERSKNNWEKSKFEKSIEAKGKKDLEEEEENEREKSSLKSYSQDEVTDKMGKDLINFKDHIFEDEGTPSNYSWSIVEDMYNEHGNSVAEMIQGFLFSCLDFVQNEKTLNLAKDYFTELIFFYKKSLRNSEKKDIIKKTIHLLKVARDNSLDNLLILDVWSIMLSNLIRAHLLSRDDLLEIGEIDKEDLKTIFVIIAKIIKQDPDAKIHYDKCKFVQKYKELYEEALKETK